ncbi:MAG: hypothetical protein JXB39_05800, partial [Deltaproteobacteria bacterium]|nr:hypothetical protein [Deltaproteobacteria bacterium]
MLPWLRRLLVLVLAACTAVATHALHVRADRVRHEVDVDTALAFLPDGASLRIAATGFHEPLADLLWVRAVLLFGQRFGVDPDPAWGRWLAGMVRAVAQLDPTWRTPYLYGGGMLRVLEDADGSDAVFLAGMEALPDDPYFPFAFGMNQVLLRDDPEAAARWLAEAGRKPGAPPWYAAAAADMLERRKMRGTALRFLREERALSQDPTVREVIAGKIADLEHEERAEKLEAARAAFRAAHGRDIERI